MKSWFHKGQTICTNAKTNFRKCAHRVENLDSKRRKQFVLYLMGFALLNLAYSLFSIYTLLSFTILTAAFIVYIKLNLKDIMKNGLIVYMPYKYQKILLHRSLFDVLCDMWFMPKVSTYAKAILKPFFMKIEPSEAVSQLKELPSSSKNAMFTKGVVNILPPFIKSIMLPPSELISDDESDTSSIAGEQKATNPVNVPEISSLECLDQEKVAEGVSNDAGSGTSLILLDALNMDNKLNSKLTQASTDDDSTIGLRMSKQLSGNPVRKMLNQKPKFGENKVVEKKGKNNKVVVSENWDNLELFARTHREKLMKQRMNSSNMGKKVELKGPLQMIQNISMLLSKDAIMDKLDSKKLMKIFLVSSLALMIQFSLSKKTRYWCYHTFHILMYVTGFVLSTGSMGVLMFKMKKKYGNWKEQQRLEAPPVNDTEKEDADEY